MWREAPLCTEANRLGLLAGQRRELRRHRRGHVPDRAPPLVERRGAPAHGDVLDLHVREAGPLEQPSQLVGIGQPERPGRLRIGSLHEPELDRGAAGSRHPVVLVRRGPDGKRRAATRSQDAGDLGERDAGVLHEHDPEAAEHAVDRPVRKVDRHQVDDPELDCLDAELGRPPPGGGNHLWCHVGREQDALRVRGGGGQEARLAGPRGELEDRSPGARIEQGDETLREVAGRLAKDARRRSQPAATARQVGRRRRSRRRAPPMPPLP